MEVNEHFYICKEMKILREWLTAKNIQWDDYSDEYDGVDEDSCHWVCRTRFEYNGCRVSVINGYGTYGGWNHEHKNAGYLELYFYDDPITDTEGWLSAQNVIEKLRGRK